jgi:hypothetical protein
MRTAEFLLFSCEIASTAAVMEGIVPVPRITPVISVMMTYNLFEEVSHYGGAAEAGVKPTEHSSPFNVSTAKYGDYLI